MLRLNNDGFNGMFVWSQILTSKFTHISVPLVNQVTCACACGEKLWRTNGSLAQSRIAQHSACPSESAMQALAHAHVTRFTNGTEMCVNLEVRI